MRILFVTPVVPSRAYGRRPYNFLHYLRGKHQLHLATFLTDPAYDRPCIEELRSWGIRVASVPGRKWASMARCVLAPAAGWPLRGMYVRSRELGNLIRKLAAEHRFDIIHFDRMRMGQYGFGLDAPKKVVDFTDSIPLYLERKRPYTRSLPARAVDWWERRTIPGFEELVLRRNHLGLLCSKADTAYFLRLHPEARIKTIVNMVDPEEWKPKEGATGEPRGVYTGTLSYEPNIDALRFLIEAIMPRVWSRIPGSRLLVYGTRPGRAVLSMIRDPRVELFANVPRLADQLSQRDIYLCPIRIGSGMRNKILEAFATEMAVVSTKVGCEGIDAEDGREILIADAAEEFAERIITVAGNFAERERLGRNGREFVLRRHIPEIVGRELERAYEELLRAAVP